MNTNPSYEDPSKYPADTAKASDLESKVSVHLTQWFRGLGIDTHQVQNSSKAIVSIVEESFRSVSDIRDAVGEMELRETEDMSLKSWTPEDYKAFGRNQLRAEVLERLNIEPITKGKE